MTTAAPSTALVTIQPAFTDAERFALAGFLAGYRGLTDLPGRRPLENGRGPPAAEAGQRPRQRPGHHLDRLAPLDRHQPCRLFSSPPSPHAGSAPRDEDTGFPWLIPITIPELPRQLRGAVIPGPRRDQAHRDGWSSWRRPHRHYAKQAHQRWHAYTDKLPE